MPALKVLDISGEEVDEGVAITEQNAAAITNEGIAMFASTMQSGCIANLSKLLLHRNAGITDKGLASLQDALLNGACGKLLTFYLEGHMGSEDAALGLSRVMKMRGIQSDLFEAEQD